MVSHRTFGSSPPCTRHPIHACAPVCCVLVVFSSPVSVLYFVPPFSFQPLLMFTSEFNERSRSNPLCDFRLGTVVTSDHETPLTEGGHGSLFSTLQTTWDNFYFANLLIYGPEHRSCGTASIELGWIFRFFVHVLVDTVVWHLK